MLCAFRLPGASEIGEAQAYDLFRIAVSLDAYADNTAVSAIKSLAWRITNSQVAALLRLTLQQRWVCKGNLAQRVLM